ncbi:hypothetical protein [Runella zeae]|jgi:hypothetical protein|uniref:hypothetical protein n=1 Tax=Runella zeae TaxID=94255 RepID=UPI00040125B9|nr:hypothetical protein [Runella zeae]
MKTLKYGFYGEDDAQKIFLTNYLKQLSQVKFELDEEFCNRFRARNKKQVDEKFREVSEQGLLWYQHDVFFVGRDLDSHSSNDYELKFEWFRQRSSHSPKILFMIPVQCIEHWLWYLKVKQDNPHSTKNETLETKPRYDAKTAVYGIPEAVNAISNPTVDHLTRHFDIDWLDSRSKSFRHFHKQIQSFLENKLD